MMINNVWFQETVPTSVVIIGSKPRGCMATQDSRKIDKFIFELCTSREGPKTILAPVPDARTLFFIVLPRFLKSMEWGVVNVFVLSLLSKKLNKRRIGDF